MQVFECPKCGAVLNINGDEEYIVCEYCDSKIKLDLPHEEKHNEDAVKLRQIEVEREFKLKAIEKEEQEAAKKNKVKKITIITWLGVSAILLLISVIKMNLSDSDGLGDSLCCFMYSFRCLLEAGSFCLRSSQIGSEIRNSFKVAAYDFHQCRAAIGERTLLKSSKFFTKLALQMYNALA